MLLCGGDPRSWQGPLEQGAPGKIRGPHAWYVRRGCTSCFSGLPLSGSADERVTVLGHGVGSTAARA